MDRVPVSVVICAKNEEASLPACLASVRGWADEVIVVDDESVDRTAETAKEGGARVLTRRMENEGRHRNWAYQQARCLWVLSLDADEQATPALKQEIDSVLPGTDRVAFAIPLRTFIGRRWVRYGGWYPASKIRLFRKDWFRYEDAEVHPRAQVDGEWGELSGDILHWGYPDWGHFLDSLNRQTTLEAQKWIRSGKVMTTGRVIRRTCDRFIRTYIRKQGYRDGLTGFMVGLMAGFYQIVAFAKYRQMQEEKDDGRSSRKRQETLSESEVRSGV